MKIFPDDLLYSLEHIWVRVDGNLATIGITDYFQDKMGELISIELPPEDSYVERDDPLGNIESVKDFFEVISPVSGEVISINEDVVDDAGIINSDPYDTSWLSVIEMKKMEELDDLLNAGEYQDFVAQEAEDD
ncbi:MAG: glycine cleavage system protein GcvH [Syntrophales bacterium]